MSNRIGSGDLVVTRTKARAVIGTVALGVGTVKDGRPGVPRSRCRFGAFVLSSTVVFQVLYSET